MTKLTRIEEVREIETKEEAEKIGKQMADKVAKKLKLNLPIPQPLPDEEFRLKLAQELVQLDGLTWDELDDADTATIESVGVREDYFLKADELYSALLQPKIEEAKREERERIRREFDMFFGHHRMKLYVRDNADLDDFDCAMAKFWQALKGGGNAKS